MTTNEALKELQKIVERFGKNAKVAEVLAILEKERATEQQNQNKKNN